MVASLAVSSDWFDDLSVIAQENPSLPILLHHLTVPRLRPPDREQDLDRLCALANLPNIGIKVSGFNYNSSRSWNFPYPDAQSVFRRIKNAFGPTRLYWGSDFPASRDVLTYRQSIEAIRHGGVVTGPDLHLVLGDNLDQLLVAW